MVFPRVSTKVLGQKMIATRHAQAEEEPTRNGSHMLIPKRRLEKIGAVISAMRNEART